MYQIAWLLALYGAIRQIFVCSCFVIAASLGSFTREPARE